MNKPAFEGAPIRTGAEYIESLRGRELRVFLFGELVAEPVDHPMIRPSINAVAETYDLAVARSGARHARSRPTPASASTASCTSPAAPDDLVMQNKMQRRLGQLTGTCFQRCVGHGRDQRAALGHLRDRREARHAPTTSASVASSRHGSSARTA